VGALQRGAEPGPHERAGRVPGDVQVVALDDRPHHRDVVIEQLGTDAEVVVVDDGGDLAAEMLKPVENFVGGYTRLFDNLDDTRVVDSWHAMNTWVSDAIPLNVIGEDDHITPPCQSEGILEMVGSTDEELLRLPGGHIGLMAGSGASKVAWPKIDAWLSERSA